MNFGVVGCGLIGRKRSLSITPPKNVLFVADKNFKKAEKLAVDIKTAIAVEDWKFICQHNDIDVVIIAVSHDSLVTVAKEALTQGKHVLIEKPAARNAAELKEIIAIANDKNLLVKVGYNHRFHPSFLKARQIVDDGKIGPLMFVRGRYGHGGRIGYENEWRAKKKISGGGELIDQGSHLIDLSQWFLGDFVEVFGKVPTLYWDMEVEDNCFLSLATETNKQAWLHASWSEWKNLFCFEIYGRDGKLQIDGLGGSYGTEKLTFYQMSEEMGPPEITSWEYPLPDNSWVTEMDEFSSAILENRQPVGNGLEALKVLMVIDEVYKSAIR